LSNTSREASSRCHGTGEGDTSVSAPEPSRGRSLGTCGITSGDLPGAASNPDRSMGSHLSHSRERHIVGPSPVMTRLPWGSGSDEQPMNTLVMDGTCTTLYDNAACHQTPLPTFTSQGGGLAGSTHEKEAFSALVGAVCGTRRPLTIPSESLAESLGESSIFVKSLKTKKPIRYGPQRSIASSVPLHTDAYNNIIATSVGGVSSDVLRAATNAADVCRDADCDGEGGGAGGSSNNLGSGGWRFAGWDDVVDDRSIVGSCVVSKNATPFKATNPGNKRSAPHDKEGMLKAFCMQKPKSKRATSTPIVGAIPSRYG
jgi:hypothetical protein